LLDAEKNGVSLVPFSLTKEKYFSYGPGDSDTAHEYAFFDAIVGYLLYNEEL
jgi:hypothetical protein